MKNWFLILLIILLLSADLSPQNWTSYTVTDGLSNNGIEAIVEDDHGKIWVGTTGGLNAFNGDWISFSRVNGDSLIHDYINAIGKDSEGKLWIGTKGGLSIIDPTVDLKDPENWNNYNQTNTKGGLVENRISAILEDDDGNVWIGTEFSGVCIVDSTHFLDLDSLLDPNHWTTIDSVNKQLCNKRIFALARDSYGNIWVGSRKGVSRYNPELHDLTGMWDLSLCDIGDVKAILPDSHGYIWFGRSGESLARVHISNLNQLDKLPKAFSADAIAEDSDGMVWIRARDEGVYVIDPRSDLNDLNNWKLFSPQPNGLADHLIKSILKDSEGDMWLGTAQKGLSRFEISWINFSEGFELDNQNVISMAEDASENVWFGTEDGGIRIVNLHDNLFVTQNWSVIQKETTPLSSNVVRAIFKDDNGNFWIGTESPEYSGLNLVNPLNNLFDPTNWQTFTADGVLWLPDNAVNAIGQDNSRFLWFGTNNGLSRIHIESIGEIGATGTVFDTSNGLTSNNIRAILIDKRDILWLGTTRGLNRIDLDGDLENGWERVDIINDKVLSIYEDLAGSIWISTKNSGVYVINPELNPHDPLNWQIITSEDGLASNFVHSLVQSSLGEKPLAKFMSKEYWFATFSGLTRLRVTENQSQMDSVWTVFRAKDGPGAISIFQVFEDSKKDLWVGTSGSGVTRHRIKRKPPDTFIEPKLDVTTADNVIIRYRGADLTTPSDQLRFSYQIDNRGWQPFLQSELVQLFNLEPGEHVFEVRAVDRDGNIDPMPDRDVFHKFDTSLGGRVEISDSIASVALHFPPGELEAGKDITITRIKNFQLADPRAIVAYEIKPISFQLNKPGTLSISLFNAENINRNQIAVFRQDNSEWVGIGGTVTSKNGELRITTAITEFGRYAVRQEKVNMAEDQQVNIQPRIFSPSGTGRGFGERANVSFVLKNDSQVTIKIYNLAGRLKRVLINDDPMFRGVNVVEWDGKDDNGNDCASGLHIVTVAAEGKMQTKTVMVLNEY